MATGGAGGAGAPAGGAGREPSFLDLGPTPSPTPDSRTVSPVDLTSVTPDSSTAKTIKLSLVLQKQKELGKEHPVDMLKRGAELVNGDLMQTGPRKSRCCIPACMRGKPPQIFTFAVPEKVPPSSKADRKMLRDVLSLERGKLSSGDCDQLLQLVQQLREGYEELQEFPDCPAIIEIKASSGISPLSMLLNTENGDIVIRSKRELSSGGFKSFRNVLIFPQKGAPRSAAEFRLLKRSRNIPGRNSKFQKEFITAEAVAQKYKNCPHIANPAIYMLGKEKDGFTKYSFIVEGANPKYPDVIERLNYHKTIDRALGKVLLEGLLAGSLGLAELHKQGDIHRDFKFENILCMQDGSYKLADLDTVCSEEEGRKATTLTGTPAFMMKSARRNPRRTQYDDLYALSMNIEKTILNHYDKHLKHLFTNEQIDTLYEIVLRTLDPAEKEISASEAANLIQRALTT